MSATVLVAEDQPMIGRILAEKLGREGYAVARVASCGALEASVAACDVALVDVDLEGDALAVMERLASRAGGPRAGWFALVDGRDPRGGARAVRAGAAGVVQKPFKPSAVAAQVATLLAVAGR